MTPTFESLSSQYASLWKSTTVRMSWQGTLRLTASKIIASRSRYELVGEKAKVPWWWIGIVHQMECSGDFSQHLHNGDPLTHRTVQVPKNRPEAPPANGGRVYSWEESALDALTIKKLSDIKSWTIERVLYEWERYNGFGYRQYHPGTLSPYLWSGTNHYTSGKYIKDGVWSSSAVSGQSGAAALLATLLGVCSDIVIDGLTPAIASPTAPADQILNAYEIEAIQRGLKSLGYYTGRPDGKWGRLTTQAVAGFRHDHNMAPGGWDKDCRVALDAALSSGKEASISETRVTASVSDIADHPTVASAQKSKDDAMKVIGGGVLTTMSTMLGEGDPVDKVQSAVAKVDQARAVGSQISSIFSGAVDWAYGHPSLILGAVIVVAGATWWLRSHNVQLSVLDLFRSGKTSD